MLELQHCTSAALYVFCVLGFLIFSSAKTPHPLWVAFHGKYILLDHKVQDSLFLGLPCFPGIPDGLESSKCFGWLFAGCFPLLVVVSRGQVGGAVVEIKREL